MHDLAFADATRPAPVCILGLRLRAYSVGAELLLTGARNPLVLAPWDAASLPDIVLGTVVRKAVLYSAMTWTECGPPPDRLLPYLWYRLNLGLTVALWRRRMFGWVWKRQPDFVAAAGAWMAYRAAGSQVPPSPDPEAEHVHAEMTGDGERRSGGRQLGGPHLARMVNYLISENRFAALGYLTPWDVPYGLASYLYATSMEEADRMKIENADEVSVKEQLAAIRAEVAAAKQQPNPDHA